MIKRYINLTIYILILLTIVLIISRRDIIERYVDITKFGSFKECETCDDGKELKGCKGLNSGSCHLCEIGWAGMGGECNKCMGKYYTSGMGSLKCDECNIDGKRVNSNNTDCEPCPKGTAGTEGVCNKCQKGEYQNSTGETICKKCSKGTYQNKKGKSKCNDCPKNTYQDEEGRTNCKSCLVKLKDRVEYNCEYYNNCSGQLKGNCSKGYVFVCGTHSNIWGKNRSKNGLAYYNTSHAGVRYLNSIYTIPFNFGNNYIKQVSCGYNHIVYLNKDDKLYGSGEGRHFGMGNKFYETPTEINAKYAVFDYDEEVWNEYEYDNKIIKISASDIHTLFLHNDNDVYCCGYDDYSQLGTYNHGYNKLVKIQRYYEYNFDEDENEYIVNKLTTPQITDISAGLTMSLFLDNNNNVYISTRDMLNISNINKYFKDYGQWKYNYGPLLLDKSDLGNGEKKINANVPGYISTNDKIYKFDHSSLKVFEEFYTINNIKNIYSGENILYVTTTDNNIYSCRGDSRYSVYPYSRLGRTGGNVSELEEVINDEKRDKSVKEINIGDFCTMILYDDGTVYGCGQNVQGVLSGIGNRNYNSYKLKLLNDFGNIKINNICGIDFSIFVRKEQ